MARETRDNVVMETFNQVVNYDLSWRINNFSKNHDGIQSSTFSPVPSIPLKCYFSCECKRNFIIKGNKECFSSSECKFTLWKCREAICPRRLRVCFEVKFTDSKGTILLKSERSSSYLVQNELSILLVNLPSRFDYLQCSSAFFYLKDDVVIFNCHFEFFGHSVTSKSNESSLVSNPTQNLSVLSSDLKALYDSKTLCDMIIRVGGNILRAHQAVLAARSPVLKNMMTSSFLESKTKCLTVSDVDVYTFECFLKYLYSGDIEDKTFTTAWNLYPLADKYDVPCLQEVCADTLVSNLNVDNVSGVLELSYLHSDTSLKDRATEFVSINFGGLKSKQEWNSLVKRYPELASEVLGYIFSGFKFP